MEIKVSNENGRVPVTVIHIDGDLDSATYQAFQTKADELIKDGTRFMLVDLSHVPYISSAGFRALHEIFNQLRKIHPDENLNDAEMRKGINAGTYKSPHLKLLNISQEARTVFEMGGFDLYIETFTDLKQAIASF
ncbi:MAG: STAS domain-containing protein [Chloroflexota bacterium]